MEAYLIPLVLTIIIELVVVFLLGFRDKPLLVGVVIVNIITNPTLNYIVLHTREAALMFGLSYILFLEGIVVIAEFLMLRAAFKNTKIPFFKLSLVMNATSFLIGVLLFW